MSRDNTSGSFHLFYRTKVSTERSRGPMTQDACSDHTELGFRGIFCVFCHPPQFTTRSRPMEVIYCEVISETLVGTGKWDREGKENQARVQYQVKCQAGRLWLDLAGDFGDNVITSQDCPHQDGRGSSGIYIPHAVHWPGSAQKGSSGFSLFVGKARGLAPRGLRRPQVLTVGSVSG